MTTNVYCFGNEFVKEDAMAKQLVDELQYPGLRFIKSNSPEDVMNEEGRIIILDVVKNIKEVIMIDNLDQLKVRNIVSLHDFDLSFFLKLMQGMGKIINIRIIGVPQQGDKKRIKEDIKAKLDELAPFQ